MVATTGLDLSVNPEFADLLTVQSFFFSYRRITVELKIASTTVNTLLSLLPVKPPCSRCISLPLSMILVVYAYLLMGEHGNTRERVTNRAWSDTKYIATPPGYPGRKGAA